MADVFALTHQPIRVTAVGFQPIYLAMDVGAYDFLDVAFGVLALEGASPSVTVELWTGMQVQSDNGYVQLLQFVTTTTPNIWQWPSIQTGLLRYLRWNVTALAGTAATFTIRGMARHKGV